jgi:hypothetical protein
MKPWRNELTFPAGVDAAALACIRRATERPYERANDEREQPGCAAEDQRGGHGPYHGSEIAVCPEGAEPQAGNGEHGHDRRGANAEQESAEAALRRNVQEIGQISDHVRSAA